jgi:hypothetical protein
MSGIYGGTGDAGFAMGYGPANTLPFRYTDDTIVNIPIPLKDLDGDHQGAPELQKAVEGQRKSGISKFLPDFVRPVKKDFVVVKMTRGEYLRYWIKGEDGKYREGVEETAEGRAEWVRRKLGEM